MVSLPTTISLFFQALAATAYAAPRWEKVQVRTSGLSNGAPNSLRIEIAQNLGTRQHDV